MTKLRTFSFIGIISVLLLIFVVAKEGKTMDTTGVPPLTLLVEQLWSIEEAESNLERSYQIGSGTIIDEALLIQLLKQSWQGDKNALLQNIIILDDAEELTEMIGNKSDYYRFLDKNRQYLVDADGKVLKEPSVLKDNRSLLVTKLADMGHPAASSMRAAAFIRLSSIRGLTDEEENSLKRYLQNTVAGGYRDKDAIADLIFFHNGVSVDNTGRFSRLIPLKEHKPEIDISEANFAVQECYLPYAMHGDPVAMVRVAEAYHLGVGVAQSDLQANIWARVSDYYLYLLIEKTDSQQRKNFLHSMQQIIQQVAEQSEAALSASESIQAQQDTAKLRDQIVFDENWKSQRDPVPPMP